MTQEAKDLAVLRKPRRTVHEAGADGLRPSSGQSEKCNRTSSTTPQKMDGSRLVPGRAASNRCHADSPRSPGGQSGLHADGPVPLHGRSDKPLASKLWHPEGSTRTHKNWTNMRRTHTTWTVCSLQADGPPGTNRTARASNREVNLSHPSMDLPNSFSSWGKIWGRYEASLEDSMPQNLWSSNELNTRESNCHRTQPKT
jgi:hypothetical protein